ncbi:SH3 domain-binding glutamic acid-rich-like protein 3 [Chroicocephalus ridibundus]
MGSWLKPHLGGCLEPGAWPGTSSWAAGAEGREEKHPRVIPLQNWTRLAQMVIPFAICDCCSPCRGDLGPFLTEHPRQGWQDHVLALSFCAACPRVALRVAYLYQPLSHPFVCTECFEYKIKLLCSTPAKRLATGAGGGRGRAPPRPHARARRPHWSPQSHAGRRRGRPLPPSEPPSAGLSAGNGRDRSMSTLKVYSTSVTGSREIKSQQSEVTRILDGKNIKYELVDISQDNALREEMRAKAGNPKAIPPQIVNGDHYCGDYELFVEAVEQNTLQEFLKLA